MLSINTNLSSLIAQSSLKSSTNILNQAVERMSTGYKINHAKDNAANYSISTNLTTKINAYQIAEDNVAMGMDMLTTADENLSLISDKLTRLRDLATQASNGTYGTNSLNAINAEANALVDEIERANSTAEYNGVRLTKEKTGLMLDVERRDTSEMDKLSDVKIDEALTSGTYSISTPEELAKLATMTNNGLIGADTEFVLANNIDLSQYENWTPIGCDSSNYFRANFDGNGYAINNLTITTPINNAGLFGYTKYSEIKNICLKDVNISGFAFVGPLIGTAHNSVTINNCSSNGNIKASGEYIGGLIGHIIVSVKVENSFSDCQIEVSELPNNTSSKSYYPSGFIGVVQENCEIKNCFSDSNIKLNRDTYTSSGFVGVLIDSSIDSCYATGSLYNSDGCSAQNCSGFVSIVSGSKINNSYTKFDIENVNRYSDFISQAGWLNGEAESNITNCYVLSDNKNARSIFLLSISRQCPIINFKDCYYNNVYDTYGTPLTTTIETDLYSMENIQSYSGGLPFAYDTDGEVTNSAESVEIQAGVSGSESSRIEVGLGYSLKGLSILRTLGNVDYDYLTVLDKMISSVNAKQVEYGSAQNRLESALNEISTQYENLVSSRSTLRDADIAEVSAEYIQQQILQQAAATLMSTANQSPAISLQLI